MSSKARLSILGGAMATLASCGGGSGGSPPVAVDPAQISSQNAPVIAGAVTKSAIEGGDLGAFSGLTSGGSILGTPDGQVFAKLGSIQSAQTKSLREQALLGVLQNPIPPQTSNCDISGTVTISGQVANPLTLSPTDTFTLVFSDCDDGAGVVNGTYVMQITSFSGDLVGGSFSLGVTVTLTDFSVLSGGQTITVAGGVSLALNTGTSPTLVISVSSSSLTVSDGISSHTLINYTATQTIDELTSAYALEVSGAVTSSAFVGRVSFDTAASLLSDGIGYAFEGEITIVGAGNASIHVIVLDSQLIRLDIDLDGNGTIDEIVDTSWDALLAQG